MPEGLFLFPDPFEPATVGEIEFDVLVSYDITMGSEVTEHPVEDGFPIHDHVICHPIKLSMVVAVSNMPVTWYDRFGGVSSTRMDDVVDKLEELYKARQPVLVFTHTKIYDDMVVTDIKIPHTKEDGKILKIPLELTQIRKVQVKTAEIPEAYVDQLTKGKAGETEKDAGTATQQDIGAGVGTGEAATATKTKSILKGLTG